MRRLNTIAVVVVAVTGLAGCATPMPKITSTAVERAGFDLGCTAADLTATPIGDTIRVGATPQSPGLERTVVGVTGCGQKAVYVVECVAGACNAVLNADTKADTRPDTTSADPG